MACTGSFIFLIGTYTETGIVVFNDKSAWRVMKERNISGHDLQCDIFLSNPLSN
jgi:hypothetical protein